MKYFFGFSYWKHEFVKPFFTKEEQREMLFINPFFKNNYFKLAKKRGLNSSSEIYIWGKKSFPLVEEYAKEHRLKLYRIEDGFIRSVGLGSDLTQPYSLVIDSRGIYFDPTQESDLEHIIQNANFTQQTLQRAKKLTNHLIKNKLSKYNLYENIDLQIANKKRVILVPGQVEDDASIRYGANGMTNLELLKQARANAEDAYIIYKPHPDVLVGNRVGHIDEQEALLYANRVVTEVGLESVLEVCSEVHTMTSLVGFEALMRGKRVFTYGMPFYAGWGLTQDSQHLKRRDRVVSVEHLVAATLLEYPSYIHPQTLQACSVEELLEGLEDERKRYSSSAMYRLKIRVRNFLSRKLQLLVRVVTLKR